MTLAYACKVTGARPKRIQNAFHLLRVGFEYRLEDVRRLGLAIWLVDSFVMELNWAWEFAGEALKSPQEVVRFGHPGGPVLEIDVGRYLSNFALACAAALKNPPRTAGRPGRVKRVKMSPAEFGIDMDALRDNAARTPEERLRSLDENWKFLQALRT